MNKNRIGALVAAAALTLTFAGTAFAATDEWEGNGYPVKEDCKESAPGDALWIWTGNSTTTPVLHIGADTYDGAQQGEGNGSYHFVAPFPESEPTGAYVEYTAGDSGTLTISHGCPGVTTTTTTTTTAPETTTTTTTAPETTTTTTTTTAPETTTTTTDVVTTTTANETTPEGSVEELTPPSTDTIGQPASSSSVSTGLLLVLAGILAAVLVVVPAAARNRR